MKTKITALLVLAAAFPLSGALAQTVTASSAPPVSVVPTAAPAAAAPNQIVYLQRLPSASELANAAAAQNLTVEKIEQSPANVIATYKTSTGQTNVVAYALIPGAGGAAGNGVTVVTPSAAPVVVAPAPAPRVVYYQPDYGYEPSYWYPPVSFRLGLNYGFRGGYYHGGGFRGGGIGFHHGR